MPKFQSLQCKVVYSDRKRDALPGCILIRSSGKMQICCPVCLNLTTLLYSLTGSDQDPSLRHPVTCEHRECMVSFRVAHGQILPC